MDEEGNQTPQGPPSPGVLPDPPTTASTVDSAPMGPALAGSLPAAPQPDPWLTPQPSPSPNTTNVANPKGGYLMIAGGIAIIASNLLPWEVHHFLDHSAATDGFATGGWLFLVISGVLAIVRGAILLKPPSRFDARTPWISPILVAVSLGIRWGSIQGNINLFKTIVGSRSPVYASLGIGFWVAVAGLALVVAGAWIGSAGTLVSSLMTQETRVKAGYLVMVGGALVVGSQVFAWENASIPARVPISLDGFHAAGGWLLLVILGAFAIARGWALVKAGVGLKVGSPWISAVLIAVALAWRWSQIFTDLGPIKSEWGDSFKGGLGIGFWIAAVGLVLIASGATTSSRARSEP